MIFFRVTDNINIKTTDGTLVKYSKLKGPSNLNNETVYVSTFDDFKDLKTVFSNVDESRYKARFIKEKAVRSLEEFPIELGVSNEDEYLRYQEYLDKSRNNFYNDDKNISFFLHLHENVDIYKQLKIKKDEVKLALIGTMGKTISEMISSCTALRILYNKLKEIYSSVKMDLYINASNNSFYTRDKQIYIKQDFISNVFPLSLNIKKLCEYDYFIDNSCVDIQNSFYKQFNYVDAWLYKFGINHEKISNHLKYNEIDITKIKVKSSLEKTIKNAKSKGKLLLFHPYSANAKKSIPQAYAAKILKDLIDKASDDYLIVSCLAIDLKIKDDNYIDLSKDSKSIDDYIYIVSSCSAVISCDTSVYHISDAFMIPTVVLFTNDDYKEKIKYYDNVKAVEIKDKSKSLSKFIFDNENLTLYKFDSWKKLKIKKIIKLLDNF